MGKRKVRLGRRILRLGHSGEDVRVLQEALQSLGYEVGEVDGHYGYLTWEAVRQLQRDHHLRVDGVTGKEVVRLLKEFQPAKSTIIHVVENGETLTDLAKKLEMPPEAILAASGLSRRQLTPGKRIVIHPKTIGGRFTPDLENGARLTLTQFPQSLCTLILSYHPIVSGGEVVGEPPQHIIDLCHYYRIEAIAGLHTSTSDPPSLAALFSKKKVRALAREALRLIPAGYRGLNLDLGFVPGSFRKGFLDLAAELVRGLRPKGRSLWITLDDSACGVRRRERWNGVTLEELGKTADLVVARPFAEIPAESGPLLSPARAETALAYLTRYIPAWKLLLAVPVQGFDFSADGQNVTPISYEDARTLAYRRKAAIQWNEDLQSSCFSYLDAGQEHIVWFENRISIRAKLDLADRYHLAGAIVWQLGWEDKRTWEEVRTRFKLARG